MAGKKTIFDNDLARHIFQNLNIEGIGDPTGIRGSDNTGNLYIALFASLSTDSTQGSEASYDNYARVAISRSASAWTIADALVLNAERVIFPPCGNASGVVVGFEICKGQSTGVNDGIFWGELDTPLNVTEGLSVVFAQGAFNLE